jgi:hypothetical protein
MIVGKLKRQIRQLNQVAEDVKRICSLLNRLQENIGRIELRQVQSINSIDLALNEFKVFSQWGEDGIIQLLLRHLEVPCRVFVEFGIQDYTESNTRFLLVNDNWAGLVIDGSQENIDYVKQDPIYWQHNLKAVHSFITKDNINSILAENGIRGEIGILSIDIDGNDYWVWQAIDVISPAIVIIEYNFRFGKERAVTIPYDEHFVRSKSHHSMIYYGASLKALDLLAKQKGYIFVGCNTAGNNAFFIRQDLKPDRLKTPTVEEGYVAAQFRESRDESGELIFISHEEEIRILSTLPLVEVGHAKF